MATGTAQLYAKTDFTEQSAQRFGGAIFNDGFLALREPQFEANVAGEFANDLLTTAKGRVR